MSNRVESESADEAGLCISTYVPLPALAMPSSAWHAPTCPRPSPPRARFWQSSLAHGSVAMPS
eukprot:14540815-Alexandrium_andersonii.AAC.1